MKWQARLLINILASIWLGYIMYDNSLVEYTNKTYAITLYILGASLYHWICVIVAECITWYFRSIGEAIRYRRHYRRVMFGKPAYMELTNTTLNSILSLEEERAYQMMKELERQGWKIKQFNEKNEEDDWLGI